MATKAEKGAILTENAEVVSVFPNKIRISVNDIEAFKTAGELLAVGSYLKVYDTNDCSIIAIIENFSIELQEVNEDGKREKTYIIEATPLGFINSDKIFVRGGNNIAIPPKSVCPASKEDIQKIYDDIPNGKRFNFSNLVQDKGVEVPVHGDKFFNKHIAVVGSTGAGKSHAVAKIIQEAAKAKEGSYQGLNNSHVIIFDIHSEYKNAFPTAHYIDVESMVLPYWMMNSEELQDLFIESSEEQSHNQVAILKKTITDNKTKHADADTTKVHYDTPTFFDLNEVLKEITDKNEEMVMGAKAGTEKQGPLHGKLNNFLTRLEGKVTDKRLEFLFAKNTYKITLEETIRQFISYEKDKTANITIIDLSGVPFEVLSITVSLISRLLFDYGYHYKKAHPDSKNETPLLVVYEEAHKYVPKSDLSKYNPSRIAIERIAKEGRKYGVSAVIVSQRPSEISETIFSQCNNFISMRLSNPDDQNYVKRLLPDTLGSLTEVLPILKAGEALLIGDAIVMPSVVQINRCDPEPSSSDVPYYEEWKKGWKEVNFGPIIKKMRS
jgi:DNA helicase HerA-like ATPase